MYSATSAGPIMKDLSKTTNPQSHSVPHECKTSAPFLIDFFASIRFSFFLSTVDCEDLSQLSDGCLHCKLLLGKNAFKLYISLKYDEVQ
jgi:hypothetical protein